MPQIDVHSFDVRVAAKEKEEATLSNDGAKKRKKEKVLRKSIFSHFTSDTRLFIATKRSLCVEMIDTVDLQGEREETLKKLLTYCLSIEGSPRQFPLEVCEQSPMHG